MKNSQIIGIDVSKSILDIFILSLDFHFTVQNNPAGFANLLEVCCTRLSCKTKKLYFCFENTGRYSRLLAVFCEQNSLSFSMVNALDVKQSKGLVRGKSDKKDAKTLASYALRKWNEIEPTVLHAPIVSKLRQLLQLRDKLVKHRTAYKNAIKDLQDCFIPGETDFIRQTNVRLIEQLNLEIKNVELEIDAIFDSMPQWKANYRLIQSVKGIGPILSKYLMIYTENFTRFSSPKKFACYAGIAPFEYSSGSSVKGRTRLHPCANKHLKSLLNIAAMSAIQLKGEYKTYYQRRNAEGKNKMSTLNIIRNKLVFRVFAVVKRQTPYVDLTNFAA
jgi:transposase